MRIVLEDDRAIWPIRVVLDPEAPPQAQQALADWSRHVMPDLSQWIAEVRGKLRRIFPAEVVVAADQAEFRAALAEADVAITESFRVTADEIRDAPRLRLVQKFGLIPRNVDAAACGARGIAVNSVRRQVNIANAEHATACLLALAKQLNMLDGCVTPARLAATGRQWGRINGPFVLNGTTLGIIGLGEIGRETARIATGLEMRVLYSQRTQVDTATESRLGVHYVARDELLATSDAIVLHLPLDDSTRGLIDGRALALMKPGALLVNTSRAALVDRAALLAALQAGRLGGVAIDALYQEPAAEDDPFLAFDNALLTPHIAGRSPATMLADVAATCLAADAALAGA